MSADTVIWRESKKGSVGQTGRLIRNTEKKHSRGRNTIFRLIFPGIFVVMAFYKIFVAEPDRGEFYTKLAADAMTRMYIQGNGPESRVNQSASNSPKSSSTESPRPGSRV